MHSSSSSNRSRDSWDHKGKTTTQRGYGWKWQQLRETILKRDMNLCQPCARKGRPEPAREVDHIKPKADGGSDDPSNLESTCIACHDIKSKRERARGKSSAPRRMQRSDGW